MVAQIVEEGRFFTLYTIEVDKLLEMFFANVRNQSVRGLHHGTECLDLTGLVRADLNHGCINLVCDL